MPISKDIILKVKKLVIEKVVEFCAKDVRPFEIITGFGFIALAQFFVSLGAKYGEFDVKNILPHPTTVSRNVSRVKNERYKKVLPIIQQAVGNSECAATTDGWSDDYKKNHYINMTAHYFDDDFVLQKNVLFTSLFNVESKTGMRIRREIVRRWELFGLDKEHLHTLPVVTDEGSPFVKAFNGRNFKRKKCYSHGINTVLRNTFDKHAPIRIEIILNSCKKIVRYLKQSGKIVQLQYAVIQETETRWNSKLGMVKSVVEHYQQIMEILNAIQRREWSFNVALARELVGFLLPFKEATDDLEGENYPTSNKILLWRTELMKHIKEGGFEGSMKTLAKAAENYMNLKIPVLMEHKIACFLDPRYRFLKMLTEHERSEVYDEVCRLLEGMQNSNEDEGAPAKKPRYSVYEELIDDKNRNEIKSYLRTADFKSLEKKHFVELFWRNNALKFPKLYKLARSRLCIPATSAPSERMWSCAGRTIDPRRTNIKPENLDDLLFIRDSYFNKE